MRKEELVKELKEQIEVEIKKVPELDLSTEDKRLNFISQGFFKTYLENMDEELYFDKETKLAVYEAINEIEEYDFITLFEVALFIGNRIDSPLTILPQSTEIFMDAILNGKLDPRSPFTSIKFSQNPKKLKLVNKEVIRVDCLPDMNWKLSLKEAAEFAITLYPREFFEDLLDTEPEIKEAPKAINNPKNDMSDTERSKLLQTIGLLTEALADTNPDFRKKGKVNYGNGEANGKGESGLTFVVLEKLRQFTGKGDVRGFGDETLSKRMNQGIKELQEKQGKEKGVRHLFL